MTTRRILWSGGFDSTYLVLDALVRGDTVEPFYVQNWKEPLWQKQRREAAALEHIVAGLPRDYRLRLRKEPRAPFIAYQDIWGAYRKLDAELRGLSHDDYSPQLPLLGAIAEELHGVSCAFVASDFSVRSETSRLFMAAHGIEVPLACRSKQELLLDAERRGFRPLLELTWSCEGNEDQAKDGACGVCGSCKARILPQRVLA